MQHSKHQQRQINTQHTKRSTTAKNGSTLQTAQHQQGRDKQRNTTVNNQEQHHAAIKQQHTNATKSEGNNKHRKLTNPYTRTNTQHKASITAHINRNKHKPQATITKRQSTDRQTQHNKTANEINKH